MAPVGAHLVAFETTLCHGEYHTRRVLNSSNATMFFMRHEARVYGTAEEIEAALEAGYTTPGRSPARYGKIEAAAKALWRGAEEVWCEPILYIVVDEDDERRQPGYRPSNHLDTESRSD